MERILAARKATPVVATTTRARGADADKPVPRTGAREAQALKTKRALS